VSEESNSLSVNDLFKIIIAEIALYYREGHTRSQAIDLLCSKGVPRETAENLADACSEASNEISLEKYDDARLQTAVKIMTLTLAAADAGSDGDDSNSDSNGSIWGALSVVIMLCILLYNGYVYFHNKSIDDYKEAVSSGKMDCEHPEVLKLAKKAIALDIKEISTPMTHEEQIRTRYPTDSGTKLILDSMAARNLNTNHISLDSIETLFTPQTPEAEKPGMLKSRLHGCSATAKLRIEPSAAEQITAELGTLLHLQNNTIEIGVIYSTNRSPSGDLEVGFSYLHPLMRVLLGSIFQAESD
jgi:hypothetical protein